MSVPVSFWPAQLLVLGMAGLVAPAMAQADETKFKPIATRSIAANRIAEKPDYAHGFGDGLDWLESGLESRTRFEHRWNDYSTPGLITQGALVTRDLLYLGIRKALDPLRLTVELEDSRRFPSDRNPNPNIDGKFEILQAYVQLHFDDALGGNPLSLSFGRMAFDWVDRRLIARNRNRNAISAFDGLRLRLGDEGAPWEIDAIAVRPVDRDVDALSRSGDHAALYGIAGHWRGWSPHVVLEPYWLWLDQDGTYADPIRRDLHHFGLHAYGQWGEGSAWDYDLSIAGQWGETDVGEQRAWAMHAEVGRTFSTAWKPRLALWLNYASGDRSPSDLGSQRFDPLYGATFSFYGYTGYFAWQNMINPALRLSFQPAPSLRCEIMLRGNWLASDTDAWVRGLRQDPTGQAGSYVGLETDARVTWQVCRNFDLDVAYAHFFPGRFVAETGPSPQGDFVQIAGTLRF